MAVYLRGVDATSHLFWNFGHSEMLQSGRTSDQLMALFGDTVPRYYVHTDSLIGDLLRAADANTTILICSDHGFQGGRNTGGVASNDSVDT